MDHLTVKRHFAGKDRDSMNGSVEEAFDRVLSLVLGVVRVTYLFVGNRRRPQSGAEALESSNGKPPDRPTAQ